jgi:threonine synthase
VTIATLRKLAERGDVKPDERTVALITGDGLKTIEAVADRAVPTMTIPPSLDAFSAQMEINK